jgi:hypothetical protein
MPPFHELPTYFLDPLRLLLVAIGRIIPIVAITVVAFIARRRPARPANEERMRPFPPPPPPSPLSTAAEVLPRATMESPPTPPLAIGRERPSVIDVEVAIVVVRRHVDVEAAPDR